MLAHWVPPQWFQIEFLNISRNPDRYAPGDPLAPAAVGLPNAFAVTMVAQPLAWMEVSSLPPGLATQTPVRDFRAIQAELQSGQIFPVGAEPDGASWTGFQSLSAGGRTGFLIVYREPLAPEVGTLVTHLPPGASIRLSPEMGAAMPLDRTVGADGSIALSLPAAGSFAVWRYEVQ